MNDDDRQRLESGDLGFFELTDEELDEILCGPEPWKYFDSL